MCWAKFSVVLITLVTLAQTEMTLPYFRAVATGMASTAMAVPLLTKQLIIQLHSIPLLYSMYHISRYSHYETFIISVKIIVANWPIVKVIVAKCLGFCV